jgi:hypothetical protein
MTIDIATASFEEVASFLETETVTGTGAAVFYSGKDASGAKNSDNAQKCADSLPGGGYTIHDTDAGKTLDALQKAFDSGAIMVQYQMLS